jgi:16S rRNA processing protein RimM
VPDEFVIVGQVVGAFGLNGALRVRLETTFPERLQAGRELIVADRRLRLREARISGEMATLAFTEVTDRTAAEALRGEFLLVPKVELPPLPEGEYYVHQIVGLRVQDPNGLTLGTVTDVLFTGANDVYVVATPTGLLYLPAIEDVVLTIDPTAGVLVAAPLEGSLPSASPKPRRRSSFRRGARARLRRDRPSPDASHTHQPAPPEGERPS